MQAALALPVQLDGYFRPSEVLSLTRCNLFLPRSRRQGWGVVVAPADADLEGDAQDVRRAKAGECRAKPSKTGSFDGKVLVADAVSCQQGRGWLAGHLAALRQHRADGQKLFGSFAFGSQSQPS